MGAPLLELPLIGLVDSSAPVLVLAFVLLPPSAEVLVEGPTGLVLPSLVGAGVVSPVSVSGAGVQAATPTTRQMAMQVGSTDWLGGRILDEMGFTDRSTTKTSRPSQYDCTPWLTARGVHPHRDGRPEAPP